MKHVINAGIALLMFLLCVVIPLVVTSQITIPVTWPN